jgi:hypothetical protein
MNVSLRDNVLRALVDARTIRGFYKHHIPNVESFDTTYEHTTENTPARRLLVDMRVKRADKK